MRDEAKPATQASALLRAVSDLPIAEGDWEIPESTLALAGLQNDIPKAREFVMRFAKWARRAVSQMPPAPRAELQATDFNDYYKLVMSRVQLLYTKAFPAAGVSDSSASQAMYPLCCFQTQLRRRPKFRKGGVMRTLGMFDSDPDPSRESSFGEMAPKFREALRAVGARKFHADTLRALLSSRGPGAAIIEESLGCINDEWIEALDGKPLFRLLDEGADFSGADAVEVKIVMFEGQAVALAQGPWFRVTFAETPLLQCMCELMTDYMCVHGDDDQIMWCREALLNFAVTVGQVTEKVVAPGAGKVAFFSGRRAPHLEFHLLQHMYLTEVWSEPATSSLLASRVLQGGAWTVRLEGTSAHEGPMAFMALHEALDGRNPVSSILWTLFFWACSSKRSILPDAFGSATFKCMLSDLGLLDKVTLARQDSGLLAHFVALFPDTPKMASEIETFADIEDGMKLGYSAFGAGGFFGEKRRSCTEFSCAAKITQATYRDAVGNVHTGYTGKLGDFSSGSGSWAKFDKTRDDEKAKGKFIVSLGADKDALFTRLLRYATAGDVVHDAASGESLLCQGEALELSDLLRKAGASLCEVKYGLIRARLLEFAVTIDKAATLLLPLRS